MSIKIAVHPAAQDEKADNMMSEQTNSIGAKPSTPSLQLGALQHFHQSRKSSLSGPSLSESLSDLDESFGIKDKGRYIKQIKYKATDTALEFRFTFHEVSLQEGESLSENFKIPLLMTMQGASQQIDDLFNTLKLEKSQEPSLKKYILLQYYSAKCSNVVERKMKLIEETRTEDMLMEFAKQKPYVQDITKYLEDYQHFISNKHDDILTSFHQDLIFPAHTYEKEQFTAILEFIGNLFQENLDLCEKFWLKEGRRYILKYRDKLRKFIEPKDKPKTKLSSIKQQEFDLERLAEKAKERKKKKKIQ